MLSKDPSRFHCRLCSTLHVRCLAVSSQEAREETVPLLVRVDAPHPAASYFGAVGSGYALSRVSLFYFPKQTGLLWSWAAFQLSWEAS